MSLARNIPTSISELAKLSDEIWYLAGDTSVDTAWYTKRASLSAVYASTGMCCPRSSDVQLSQRGLLPVHGEYLPCSITSSRPPVFPQ